MSEDTIEKPILTVLEGKYANQFWVLDKDSVILGRDDVCDIVIPERQISRQHVRIFCKDRQYHIEDLDSRNGTWLNGQRIEDIHELFDGDEIHLALAFRLRFI